MLRSPAPHSFGSSAARIWRFPPKSLHRSSEINNFFRRDLDSGGGGGGGGTAFISSAGNLKEEAERRGWMTPVEHRLARSFARPVSLSAFASNAIFSPLPQRSLTS